MTIYGMYHKVGRENFPLLHDMLFLSVAKDLIKKTRMQEIQNGTRTKKQTTRNSKVEKLISMV